MLYDVECWAMRIGQVKRKYERNIVKDCFGHICKRPNIAPQCKEHKDYK